MMREKKRYLLVKFTGEEKLTSETVKHLVYEAIFQFIGELGASKAAVQVIKFDAKTQTGVVKCATAMLEETIAAFALKRYWHKKPVRIETLKATGLINRLKDAAT